MSRFHRKKSKGQYLHCNLKKWECNRNRQFAKWIFEKWETILCISWTLHSLLFECHCRVTDAWCQSIICHYLKGEMTIVTHSVHVTGALVLSKFSVKYWFDDRRSILKTINYWARDKIDSYFLGLPLITFVLCTIEKHKINELWHIFMFFLL